MINKNKDRGITLVALVITIIILLILATISIQSLTNTGLFQKAQEAKEKTQNAEENQAKTLNEYEDELNKYISGTVEERKDPIKEVAHKVLSTTDNTELEDAYGNKIVVPAGFKIVSDSTTNNAQTVNQGIVIEDATKTAEGTETSTSGSQFVWIPVGKIYTDVAKTDANAKTIELNRYTFDSNGKPTAQGEKVIETYYSETASKGNTVAKDINAFKTSVATNGGYYIGRYEARTTTKRTAEGNALTQITEKGTDQIYNYVKQSQAAKLSQEMYNSNKFTSDLMNGYAWDTATLFLQTCGTNTTYSRKNSVNTALSQTGTNIQKTKDVQCNVYDMASNVLEWTTETSYKPNIPCVGRGGYYYNSNYYTSDRNYDNTSNSYDRIGFRPLLYLNI